jgi:dienelactone hydrolase
MIKRRIPVRSGARAVLFGALILAWSIFAQAVSAEPAGPNHSSRAFAIELQPGTALMGTPFSLLLTGLKPDEQVTVSAQSIDKRGRMWKSQALFVATNQGMVDITSQAPASGSYAGPDIFGLLWSMKPPESQGKRPPSYANDETNGWTVDFSATDSEGKMVSARLRRVYQMPETRLIRVPLDKEGMRGFLYYPAEGGPFPGVIILGGSNGGLYEWLAQAMASNGFAALTLAYFNYSDLPAELVNIPLEYFHRAAVWMKTQPGVKTGYIGLAGGSKGGELALLLASRYDDYQAVVAWTPAAHAWEGLSQKYFSPDYVPVSSWSFDGRPLPFVRFNSTPEDKEKESKGELLSYVSLHHRALAANDPELIKQAAIPVDRIKAPILLISGTLDQTWPADEFCRGIAGQLDKARFPYEVRHISHQDAGHQSFLPYLITANTPAINGGSDRANAAAGFLSWKETIAFLRRHLGR